MKKPLHKPRIPHSSRTLSPSKTPGLDKVSSAYGLQKLIQRTPDNTGTNNMPSLKGKVYDTKGDLLGVLGEDTGEPIIVLNKKLRKAIKKEIKAAEKAGSDYVMDASGWASTDYCILPPYSHRQEMKRIMENDDTNSYQEFGGRGLIPIDIESGELLHDKKVHVRSEDGNPAGPTDGAASISLNSIHQEERENITDKLPSGFYATDYTWHSHPGGSWKKKEGEPDSAYKPSAEFNRDQMASNTGSKTTMGGPGIVTSSFDLGPSVRDLNNAHRKYEETKDTPSSGATEAYPMTRNFVIHKKEKKVFFYNQETSVQKGNSNGVIPLDVFWTVQ